MTAAAQPHDARPGGAGDASDLAPIVHDIEYADARRRRRFRIVFALTWIVVIGGLIAVLLWADAIDVEFMGRWWQFILGGAGATILISVSAILLAIVFALAGAMGRLAKSAPIYAIATLYVSLVRGTPLLVQILFIWLALPQIWPGFGTVDAFIMGTFAVAFNYGAYMTEVFRAGIQAVPPGQREAAEALGLTQRRVMARIVLPQAIRIVIPAIGNEFIAMIKDTSLLAVIGVTELLWRARTVGSSNFRMLETLLIAALMYWVLTIIFSYAQERLERRMARSDR